MDSGRYSLCVSVCVCVCAASKPETGSDVDGQISSPAAVVSAVDPCWCLWVFLLLLLLLLSVCCGCVRYVQLTV